MKKIVIYLNNGFKYTYGGTLNYDELVNSIRFSDSHLYKFTDTDGLKKTIDIERIASIEEKE